MKKNVFKKIGALMIALICAFALCACGSSSSNEESEQATEAETTAEAPQDPLVGEYDLLGVTYQISDDIDSYLTAPIDEELSLQFGEEQIYLKDDGSFERKAGDTDVDSGTWEKGDSNTLSTIGQVTMEFRYNDDGTVLVEMADAEYVNLVGKDFAFVYKKKQ